MKRILGPFHFGKKPEISVGAKVEFQIGNPYIKPNFWHLISILQEFKTLFEFESTETQQYLDWQMKIPHFWCEKTKIMTGIKCATSRNRPAL